MTCRDSLQCAHEPFGDAYYYGPERLGARYENDEKTRVDSGFGNTTFSTILERFAQESTEVSTLLSSAVCFKMLRFFLFKLFRI